MSTAQADKRDTIAAITERNDRIDKKIRDEVTQLEINVRDEDQRLIERFQKENEKLRNDLN
jgi:hypothetical protein